MLGSTQEISLERYVPVHILRRLAHDPRPISEPSVERLDAAVLFADISGFSALTERLASQGAAGAEEITKHLNAYFGRLIDVVLNAGGDVVKFAGDALVAIWRAEDDLPAATQLAAQACLAIQQQLHNLEVGEGVRMSVRLCLESGPVAVMQLGGLLDRWESLLAGAPFEAIGTNKPNTQPGETVISRATWELIAATCAGEPSADAMRLTGVKERVRPVPLTYDPPGEEAAVALRAMIPGVVLSRVGAGQGEWLGELRRVSVLFVALPGGDALDWMQRVVSGIQRAVYKFGGSINKISVDEKGATLVAAFGLPPMSHEDDPGRALKAGLGMANGLRSLGITPRIGVATGQVFCGTVGNNRRSEYTMIGKVVNTAARLMEAAEDEVLGCAQTFRGAERELGFGEPRTLDLRGMKESIQVYKPTGERLVTLRHQVELVGRATEQQLLSERLQSLVRTRTSGTIVVRGEAGIGKSRFLQEVIQSARSFGVHVFLGAGQAVEQNTPYHAWRPVFIQMFKLQAAMAPDARAAYILQQLDGDEELARLAPLLNVVLPIDLDDNEFTEKMSGEVRAYNTHKLLASLLLRSANDSPVMVVIEDAHWFDSASWAVVRQVIRDVPPVMVFLATRPMPEPFPPEYEEILGQEDTDSIKLAGLTRADTSTLIRQRLEVLRLPEEVGRLVHDRTAGNPLFSEELAYLLRDTGRIIVDHEDCRLAVSPEEFRQTALPGTHGEEGRSRRARLLQGLRVR